MPRSTAVSGECGPSRIPTPEQEDERRVNRELGRLRE